MNTTTVEESRSSGQIIWDTIQALHQQGQVATRELVSRLTELKMTIVDDHVSRMVEEGRVMRLRPGVFSPVAAMPEPRAISTTDMPDGTVLLEIGEYLVHLWPRETRTLARRLAGEAVQYSNIQAGATAGTVAAEVLEQMMTMRREMSVRLKDQEAEILKLKLQLAESPRQGALI